MQAVTIVPSALETLAEQLTLTTSVNPFSKLTPVVEPRLPDSETIALRVTVIDENSKKPPPGRER